MRFKVVISGVSGRIGAQVLEQALGNASISCIVALSRRALPELAGHAQLEVVVLDDFTKYPDDVVAKLSGADGAIW
jgi:dihydrodipicolinate reductase